MIIDYVIPKNFRNLKYDRINFSEKATLFCGSNAQGKTNLLESIFFLSCAKSFRTKKDRELITFGCQSAFVESRVTTQSRSLIISGKIDKNGKKEICVNEIPRKRLIDHIGVFTTILFSPDDLALVKEGPAERRRFLDLAISQLYPGYIRTLCEHNRIIAQKAAHLKGEIDENLVEIYNRKIARLMCSITGYRKEFIELLEKNTQRFLKEMSLGKDSITLLYKKDSSLDAGLENAEEKIFKHLSDRRDAEKEAKICLVGSHRDDLDIIVNGESAKSFASQGQIRSVVLALKLGEREIMKRVTGELPVLLLDDILSELDENRRSFVLESIVDGQVIITDCALRAKSKRTVFYNIEGGMVEKCTST